MNRRQFITKTTSMAGITASMTLSQKADALEDAMINELGNRTVIRPHLLCHAGQPPAANELSEKINEAYINGASKEGVGLMGDDPRLPKMPKIPTLIDFFNYRFGTRAQHVLQSANLARKNRLDETVITACLLHDLSNAALIKADHGYWGAQLVAPYVTEEVSWAIKHHQALRFYSDESVGYDYPEGYRIMFGTEYQPEPYIQRAYKYARNHKWYMTSRHITVNDLYAFDDSVTVQVEDFTDIIGRNFRQPKEGLGLDDSPSSHMWRTMIWPNNTL